MAARERNAYRTAIRTFSFWLSHESFPALRKPDTPLLYT
ncbi:hypothetical protein SBA5_360014 [Candidatus Sulfotelmatomonas gaucii]|uniref:Uncharacterized protein n=1 Tax=Candidatus Sulfuritelmatomonas gaucii TaxID=2043161 RepID=A0A2N9LHN5_9BACT|nr:hypothetical protein SBA5_360014 [Candidatus Sulfotelmatomonas gaucii]